jgi:hypothetical protein
MTPRYPGYDVLAKRNTPSWNEVTRRVIDRRLSLHPGPRFFDAAQWQTLVAVCDRIIPQPKDRAPVPLPAFVDAKMFKDEGDGYRFEGVLPQREAWQVGLAALDHAAQARHGAGFHALAAAEQDAVLKACQAGELDGPEWHGMSSRLFFSKRVIHDIISAYYAHPTAWNEMGWGGPASPRGYVRMDANKRDPWEAAEAHPGEEEKALRANRHVV